MTVSKGVEWGEPVDRPTDLVAASSDAEFVRLSRSGEGVAVTLTAGDLHRSLGAPGPRSAMRSLPIDLIEVCLDGAKQFAVAHVAIFRSRWRGEMIVVSNVSMMGEWNVAPKAHPNDGRLDIIEVAPALEWRQRVLARRRLLTGTHIPHPHIDYRRAEAAEWTFERPIPVRVDGRAPVRATTVAVRVLPDETRVVI